VQQGLRGDDLVDEAERKNRVAVLEECIEQLVDALKVTQRPDPWGEDIKVTDEFLDPLFKNYYTRLGISQQTYKRDYHGLADAIPVEEISDEVIAMLDSIAEVACRATPES
jgi:hypothetical protein